MPNDRKVTYNILSLDAAIYPRLAEIRLMVNEKVTEVIRTQDRQVHDALVYLGWTPPGATARRTPDREAVARVIDPWAFEYAQEGHNWPAVHLNWIRVDQYTVRRIQSAYARTDTVLALMEGKQ